MDRSHEERETRMAQVDTQAKALAARLNVMSVEQVGEFLKLDVLSEVLDRRVGQVGRYERGVFSDAFEVLLAENFELSNMEPCWRAN
jgi:hypothetical protein